MRWVGRVGRREKIPPADLDSPHTESEDAQRRRWLSLEGFDGRQTAHE